MYLSIKIILSGIQLYNNAKIKFRHPKNIIHSYLFKKYNFHGKKLNNR